VTRINFNIDITLFDKGRGLRAFLLKAVNYFKNRGMLPIKSHSEGNLVRGFFVGIK